MPLANREQEQRRSRNIRIDGEDGSPPTTWLRNVVLRATAEIGPVTSFGFARAK